MPFYKVHDDDRQRWIDADSPESAVRTFAGGHRAGECWVDVDGVEAEYYWEIEPRVSAAPVDTEDGE